MIVFVGSPVTEDDRALKQLGDQLRKNNVSECHGLAIACILYACLRVLVREHVRVCAHAAFFVLVCVSMYELSLFGFLWFLFSAAYWALQL